MSLEWLIGYLIKAIPLAAAGWLYGMAAAGMLKVINRDPPPDLGYFERVVLSFMWPVVVTGGLILTARDK